MSKIKEAQTKAARDTVCQALAQANGRIVDAAKLLGVSRQALQNQIRRLNLNPADWRIK